MWMRFGLPSSVTTILASQCLAFATFTLVTPWNLDALFITSGRSRINSTSCVAAGGGAQQQGGGIMKVNEKKKK